MSRYKEPSDGLRSPCAEISTDDGQAPNRHSGRVSWSRRSKSRQSRSAFGTNDRKAHQLCRQVAHTLDEVLAECGDAVLQGLRVDGVEPFPDASRLIVTVAFIDNRPAAVADVARAMGHLERASGHLRREVAAAITRRRAPLLLYRLAEPSPV